MPDWFFCQGTEKQPTVQKNRVGFRRNFMLVSFPAPQQPTRRPIQSCQLYSKCAPLQLRPTGPRAPSRERRATLQSWQVAPAVRGIILKVTYETPSAHQMQQYEQLKFDTHSPYWLPFFCLLLLTAPKRAKITYGNGSAETSSFCASEGARGNRPGRVCVDRRACVGRGLSSCVYCP